MAVLSTPERSPYKKSKSAVLRSFVSPRSRDTSPTKGPILREIPHDQIINGFKSQALTSNPIMLPADHPHANQLLSSRSNAAGFHMSKSTSPQKPPAQTTPSSRAIDGSPTKSNNEHNSPIKRKSQVAIPKDKENTNPSTLSSPTASTPIWSQCANASPTKIPGAQNNHNDEIRQARFPIAVTTPAIPPESKGKLQGNAGSWFDSKDDVRKDTRDELLNSRRASERHAKPNTSSLPLNAPKQTSYRNNELDAALEAILVCMASLMNNSELITS